MRISDWSSDVCSSDLIPVGLVESEFFGHTRGAFTGAISDMPGKIRLADKSTLFLDAIGELDDQNQAKLLRVIESKEVFAVGGNRGMRCDVRLMDDDNRHAPTDSAERRRSGEDGGRRGRYR